MNTTPLQQVNTLQEEIENEGVIENMNGKLLTPKEAAKLLNLSVSTLAKRRQEKKDPPFVKFGKSVRYREVDLDEFIKSNIK